MDLLDQNAPSAAPSANMARTQSREGRSVAGVFLQHLAGHGVRLAFGIPGGTISPVYDALRFQDAIRHIASRHEAMAAFAALGYARASGLPAIVLVTSGPGITNTVSALASAHYEDLPLIVVGGDVPMRAMGTGAIQDGSAAGVNLQAILQPITRWCGTLTDPTRAASLAEHLWQRAMGFGASRRPGPVAVMLPLDVSNTAVEHSRAQLCFSNCDAGTHCVDAQAVARAAALLRHAQRPLLVVGNGARRAARHTLEVAERFALPTTVTGHAKGVFPERHPLYLGIMGLGQHPSVEAYLSQQPDVTLVIGSRLNDIATNGGSLRLAGTQATIRIDRDPLNIGANIAVTHALTGDAAAHLDAINAHGPERPPPRRLGLGLGGCQSLRAEFATSDAIPLKPQRVLAALQEAFPGAIYCADIGEHLSHALHYLRVESADKFHNMLGYGSMASGFGAAVGLKLAKPETPVVCICGDGGFMMHPGELLTCVENHIEVIFAIFNDGRWNMVEHGFRAIYGGANSTLPGKTVDLGAAAGAFGAIGVRIDKPEHLVASHLRRNIGASVPVVFDIRIDATESLSTDTRTASIKHFASEFLGS